MNTRFHTSLAFLILLSGAMTVTSSKLIDIVSLIPDVVLDIRYATENNFTGKQVYNQARCFLQEKTAHKLKAVQDELRSLGLGIKIFDGYRPHAASKKFWELVPDERYVANPAKGSRHNRGAAIDLTLIESKTGQELEMPSGFDDFSAKAHREYETMPSVAARNCKLLETLMEKHGFVGLPTEWWHFDDQDWRAYPILDRSFEELDVDGSQSPASQTAIQDQSSLEKEL